MADNDTTLWRANSTLPIGPNWTFTPTFTLFIQVTAILMNGSVLNLFARDALLLTPFTIYVMNLFVANLSSAIFFYTIEVVNDLYSFWWMGYAACTYYNYTNWMLNASMCNSHALIALNRLWAVTFPVSYRRYHRKRFALAVCAAMWIYLHACLLPGIIRDAVWYRLPEETNGCLVNTEAQQLYALVMQLMVYDLPEAFVLLMYPVICYKTWRRRRVYVRPSGTENVKMDSLHTGHAVSSTGVAKNEDGAVESGSRSRRGSRRVNHGLLSLTLMTLTVLVCYTPGQTYFTLLLVFGVDVPNMYPITSVMNALIVVLDPVWFVLALANLRNAFRRTYCG